MAEKEEADARTTALMSASCDDKSSIELKHIAGVSNCTRHNDESIKNEFIDEDISSGNSKCNMGLHTEIYIKSESSVFCDTEVATQTVNNETNIKTEDLFFGEMPLHEAESKVEEEHGFPYDVTLIHDHSKEDCLFKSTLAQYTSKHDSAKGPKRSIQLDQQLNDERASRSAVKTLQPRAASSNSRVQTNPTAATTTEFFESKPDILTVPKQTFICDYCNGQFIAVSALEQPNAAANVVIAESISLKCSVCGLGSIPKKGLYGDEGRFTCITCAEKVFKCANCEINSLKGGFDTHLRAHVGFKCNFCDYQSARSSNLQAHIRTHTGEKPYKCKVCGFKCATSSYLKVHIRKHTGDKPYKCSLCNYESALGSNLKTHIRTHTGEKPYKCNLCDFKCARSSHLGRHIRTHTGDKPYKCDLCDFKCARSSHLGRHIRTHTDDKPYKCNLCHFKSTCSSHLKVHIRTHTGDKPYKCNLCDFKCATSSQLNVHIKTHTEDKHYKCNLCDYKCVTNHTLKVHIRTHTGDRPFKCNLCDFKCATSSNLKVHIRTHTGDKPYKCNLCDYKSARSSDLKTHIRKHTGEQPYKCNLCDYKCTRSIFLNRHIKAHTGDKP